ncbi:UPF0500 protein C1orf216 homolog [Osmerus mordax]|uniref:UPF0500 protein C1orf216 homolog n=1 Tax=Osmerus mordax TaxID=8014 RepID=UPI003510607A
MGESQSKPRMLHQDRPANSNYGGQGGGVGGGSSSSLRLLSNCQQQTNRKCEKDGNFNFLGREDEVLTGDENRNQVRPRSLGPLGRDPPLPPPTIHYHGPGLLSPLSRLPCWSPLEPLPEIESGDDGYGRVPPDGAEEGKMEEETGRMSDDDKDREPRAIQGGRKEGVELEGEEGGEGEERVEEEDGEEWGDSGSEFEFSYRSSGSLSSLNMESGGEGALMGGWDRIGVGEPRSDLQGTDGPPGTDDPLSDPTKKCEKDAEGRRWGRKTLAASAMGSSLPDDDEEEEEQEERGGHSSDSDTDPCGELPELLDAVWTLRDRERFKAQEMEKHQVQLTMYRRLALIRWVRTLQGRVQEQQNRLQSSFDVILTHRKELLRMGASTAANTTASQS